VSENNADMAKCMSKVAECHGRMCECLGKADGGDDLQKMIGAVTSAVMTHVYEKLGTTVVPSLVKGAFFTEDPNAASGLTLINRQGGPSLPVNTERIDPVFRNLFTE
jgi:hypothetical protein